MDLCLDSHYLKFSRRAILDLRLQKPTGLERDKIKEEHIEIMKGLKVYKKFFQMKT